MRLALASINPTIGDLRANADRIINFTRRAREAGADLVVFPELSLTGYPPKDLLLAPGFIADCAAIAREIGERHTQGITLVFGAPLPLNDSRTRLSNALLAYSDNEPITYYDKRLLPTYDVFDENRYFEPGDKPALIDVVGVRVGLSICEDLWRGHDVGFAERYLKSPDPVAELITPPDGSRGADLIINPSASPFVLGKSARHRELLRTHAVRHKVHIAAVNQVGGNDELIFDGQSCVFDPNGQLTASGETFREALTIVEIRARSVSEGQLTASTHDSRAVASSPMHAAALTHAALSSAAPLSHASGSDDSALLFAALTLGIRDYCRKTGFRTAVLGLSGGIDSAVVAALACAALGPSNVTGLLMPSQYSSRGSIDDARELARRLGMAHTTIAIESAFHAFEHQLAPLFEGRSPDVTEENLQSRIRGTLLMAASNKFGHILLTTGNKSELAVGYCTLYGDMNGGLAVISDVLKMQVYALANWMNTHFAHLGIPGLCEPPIPESSITKAPSAELRPNQTDQDSLPPYPILDEIIERYVEDRESPASILSAMKLDAPTLRRTIRLIDLAEYKRKQAPIGLKVTGVAFGSGRRMPIAQGYRPDRSL
jgi:NAD+ synthetase